MPDSGIAAWEQRENMFGYIAPRMELLTEESKRRYQEFYCGLCAEIGFLSGRSGRMLLSHDMVFLAILLNSLMDQGETERAIRCGVHPFRQRHTLTCEAVRYAAAMNILLMDFKCEDQIRDDQSRTAALERKMLSSSVAELQKKYADQYDGIREAVYTLWEEERKSGPDADRLCNLSGEMLGAVYSAPWVDAYWLAAVRNVGKGLGRFIYWMDAWDDQETDRRRGHFNPLFLMDHTELPGQMIQDELEMLIGEAAECFEMLPLEKDLDLLRNVLYSGVWQRYDASAQRQKGGKG